MRFGVAVFPGSNAADCYHIIDQVLGHSVAYIWHQERDLTGFDCVILPGGFSYGDYLRAGSVASLAPVMEETVKFAEQGGLVLGIGNGFQVLLEADLLPGAMRRNEIPQFRCHDVFLKVESNTLPFTNRYRRGEVIRVPSAHGEGNYYIDHQELAKMEQQGQVVFRYCTEAGEITPEANPNGSIENIAGVCSKKGNVLGLMPHPERCAEEILGNTAGRRVFLSILNWLGINQQKKVIVHG